MKSLKWNMIFLSSVYLILGIVLLIWPDVVLGGICMLIGCLIAGTGIVQLARFFLVRERLFFAPLTLIGGLICLGLGLFLLLRSDVILTALPIVFGLFIVFDSVVRIQNALELRRCGYNTWKGILASGAVSVILGLVMLFNPFGTVQALVMAIGIILIVEGILNLASMAYTAFAVKAYLNEHADDMVSEWNAVNAAFDKGATLEGSAVEIDVDDSSDQ